MLKKVATQNTDTFSTRSLSLEYLDQHYRQEWNHLATQCLDSNIFYTPSFLMALRHHLLPHHKITILTCWRQAERKLPELVAVFPMVYNRFSWGLPVKRLQSLTHPYITSTTPLIHKEYAEESVITVLDYLEEHSGQYAIINMPLITSNDSFYAILNQELSFRERAITVLSSHQRPALTNKISPNDYLASIRKSRKRDLKKNAAALEQLGSIQKISYKNSEDLKKGLALFLDLEASGWKGRKGSAMKSSAKTRAFAQEALCIITASSRPQYDFLALDGKIIAGTLTLIHGTKAWTYKSAYDENYRKYAPSLLALHTLSQDLLSDDSITVTDSAAKPGHVLESMWTERITIDDVLFPTGEQVSPVHITALSKAYQYYFKAREKLKDLVMHLKKQ